MRLMRVGFNSRIFRRYNISLMNTIKIIKEQDANAFELCFRSSQSLLEFELTEDLIDALNSFDYLSVHSPFDPLENLNYKNDEFGRKIILKLKELVEKLNIEGIVFHPSNIEDFDFLDSLDMPVLIENMSFLKNSFKTIEDFKKLKGKYGFGFVLDLEHCLENDMSLKLAYDFIEVMGDRLKEVHLSGAKKSSGIVGNNHCLLMKSEYRNELLGCLNKIKNVPIILEASIEEGVENYEKLIKDEIDFVRGLG